MLAALEEKRQENDSLSSAARLTAHRLARDDAGHAQAPRDRARHVWLEASEILVAAGAFFDRPYGPWAQLMYARSGAYAEKLRGLKRELDPNNIMNPGRLCFNGG